MVAFQRYAEKFTNIAGSLTYTFPLERYEYNYGEQEYRPGLIQAVGADYAWDNSGANPWPLSPATEIVKFLLTGTNAEKDTAWDTLVSVLRTIGTGKLWTLTDAGVRRWCYAKLANRPRMLIGVKQPWNPEVEVTFVRLSDWFAETASTGSQALSGTTTSFSIVNAGNVDAMFGVFRLRASSSTGFTNPVLMNLSNGMQIASTRDATLTTSELKYDAGEGSVEYSTNDGASYAPDFDLVTLPSTQVGLMRLAPGSNSMRVTSTAAMSGTLDWSFFAQYA